MTLDQFLITIDTDWAPDWMIEEVAKPLIANNVKATWFVTHKSSAIDALRKYDKLFEIGLHPNFLQDSSQGNSYQEVISSLLEIYPNTKTVRSHSLFQCGKVLKMLVEEYGIRIDCSIHLRKCANIEPFVVKYSTDGPLLCRVPHYFQDNIDMSSALSWELKDNGLKKSGLKVFCFHPLHIILNSKNVEPYDNMKKRFQIPELTPDKIAPYINYSSGTRNLFNEIIYHLNRQRSSYKITDIVSLWKEKVYK